MGELDVQKGGYLIKKNVYGQYVPINIVLKKFLESHGTLNEILTYMESLKNNTVVENFIQCNLWKRLRGKFPADVIVIPLYYYYDACQCNNPLGSHAEKLGCSYVQIACLPPEVQSKVDFIFLALVFKTAYRCFTDKVAFKPLIDILTSLEKNGITVNTSEGPKQVYFISGLMLGDNLGLNSLGGFAESFTANFFCRFCKTQKEMTWFQTMEDKSTLRTEENYNEDLSVNDVKMTGVKFDSAFNALPSFHVTSNFCVDIFHDLFEGVCHYVMLHVLRHCVPLFFTLDLLNHRIEMFKYSLCDSNRVPIISDDFAKRDKFKMSGSETLLFVRLFGIIVGDKVPCDDPFWLLYVKLRNILDICLSKNLSRQQGTSLKVLVQEFLSMYVQVTKDTLKPKFHNLLHYCTAIEESGPVSLTSTIRFESKHRSLLIPARATESRQNICRTVAIQHQLNMMYWLKSKSSAVSQTDFGPVSEVFSSDFSNPEFVNQLPVNFKLSPSHSCLSANWVDYKGTKYQPGMVLLLSFDASGGPVFGKLESILVSEGDVPLFVFSYMLCLGFSNHLHSYEVKFCDKWSVTFPDNLCDPLPLGFYFSISGKLLVSLRYAL